MSGVSAMNLIIFEPFVVVRGEKNCLITPLNCQFLSIMDTFWSSTVNCPSQRDVDCSLIPSVAFHLCADMRQKKNVLITYDFSFSSKAFSRRTDFLLLFRVVNHQIVDNKN